MPSARCPPARGRPAYDGDGQVRDGAWVAELTGLLILTGWPKGMRVIARKERPHPGAQLRFTDIDGHRFTCFATSASTGQLADLELRHRRRARCEDRIRCAKDTGLRNLPLHPRRTGNPDCTPWPWFAAARPAGVGDFPVRLVGHKKPSSCVAAGMAGSLRASVIGLDGESG